MNNKKANKKTGSALERRSKLKPKASQTKQTNKSIAKSQETSKSKSLISSPAQVISEEDIKHKLKEIHQEILYKIEDQITRGEIGIVGDKLPYKVQMSLKDRAKEIGVDEFGEHLILTKKDKHKFQVHLEHPKFKKLVETYHITDGSFADHDAVTDKVASDIVSAAIEISIIEMLASNKKSKGAPPKKYEIH